MITKDLYSNVLAERAISPVTATDNTALTGQIIDRQGYQSLAFVIATGTLADADATFAVTMEHGDQSDLSDTAAVTNSDLQGTLASAGFTFADDDECRVIGYKGDKRYVRITITPTGNAGNAPIACVALKGHPLAAPVTQGS